MDKDDGESPSSSKGKEGSAGASDLAPSASIRRSFSARTTGHSSRSPLNRVSASAPAFEPQRLEFVDTDEDVGIEHDVKSADGDDMQDVD